MGSFSWVLDGRLGGMARPGRTRLLEEDLAELAREGVTAIVSLVEKLDGLDAYRAAGFRAYHIPVFDFGAPTLEQIEACCALIDDELARGGAVALHCQMGIGRTGTMLVAYLIHQGSSFEEALAEVRRRRPATSVESPAQVAVLRALEIARRGGKPRP